MLQNVIMNSQIKEVRRNLSGVEGRMDRMEEEGNRLPEGLLVALCAGASLAVSLAVVGAGMWVWRREERGREEKDGK